MSGRASAIISIFQWQNGGKERISKEAKMLSQKSHKTLPLDIWPDTILLGPGNTVFLLGTFYCPNKTRGPKTKG